MTPWRRRRLPLPTARASRSRRALAWRAFPRTPRTARPCSTPPIAPCTPPSRPVRAASFRREGAMSDEKKSLSGRQRAYLKGLAHAYKPLVQVGHEGVSESVVKQVDAALKDHELIKVRLSRPED